jgi:hypothetical protein
MMLSTKPPAAPPDADGDEQHDGFLETVTKAAAIRLNRRGLLGRVAAASVASVGIKLLGFSVPASAACDNWSTCFGPCAHCQSCIYQCCSPGGWCIYNWCCYCNFGCACSCFVLKIQMCDGGDYGVSCLFCSPIC